ncbi:30S ribosomal protein S18 [Neoehrlichia mikurensis]|uniref:Small ribosomal subunit protein bS18 n=1 Tax=Neoehrlichia mikurensis TaxID=89586 RepID=A0A9Q9F3S5_9RICK|nr:30S ribosomal protein S18 [Neoehrlichia mikurensis]QXK91719.1 30S ribosomal protein S18 [Neoehrlichia mikurensis]QXK92931.1 30S ribosomal protein S18 [Neoehrlichia mikurensis]QXK93409.1 30S ribosomal protein S18 [Neoehrlichia mikurensis]UTO55640.1 30S ribosomal protein S18 [Neoehrlichia mikurensis]UTO56560.1 30S ribosomal protein S18 [Neoehrlichia mikurensis]
MLQKNKKNSTSTGTGSSVYSSLAYLKRPYFKRSKSCPLAQCSNDEIDYKNKLLLTKFISEYGRILPSRITSVSSRKQRLLALAVKRARFLALLPYC